MVSHYTGIGLAVLVVIGIVGLLGFAQEGSVSLRDKQTAALSHSSLIEVSKNPEAENQLEAILQLAEVSGGLEVSVPVLAELAMSPDELTRIAAEIALRKIGPEGAIHLAAMINSADEAQITQACTALHELGTVAEFLPILKKWLTTGDTIGRKRALFVLQADQESALQVLVLVIEALEDPDFNVQCMACRVLEKLGADAIPAEDKVLELFKNGIPSARSWAAVVLGSIGPTAKTDTAQILGDNLNAFLQVEKQRTLLGLAHLGPEASKVAEQVRALMHDEAMHVMPHAAYTLWVITNQPEPTLEVLKKMLADRSYFEDTVELIGKMQAAGAPLVDDLIAHLDSEEPELRELIVVALGNIGPSASAAKPALEKLSQDPDVLLRYAAQEALKQINATEPAAAK